MRNTKWATGLVIVTIVLLFIAVQFTWAMDTKSARYGRNMEQRSMEEEISVASLTPQLQDHVGKSVSVIDHTILEEYKPLMLTDSLHNIPGVYVKRLNGLSGLTNVRIRGARSIDTKLLYNGLPLQDPSDPQASANPIWGDLISSLVKKVEVLSGASSTTWGSEAIGGVINLIPEKGDIDETERETVRLGGGYGTFETANETILVRAGAFRIGLSRLDSEGFDHHDDYHNTTGNLSYFFSPSNKLSVGLSGFYSETEARVNDAPVISGSQLIEDIDDPNDKREYSLFHGGVKTVLGITDSISFQNKTGLTDSDRRFTFLIDPDGSDFYSDGIFRGNDFIEENQITVRHTDHLATTVGHQYNRQWYELDQKDLRESDQADSYSNDFYVEETIDIDNLHLLLGARENTHEYAKHRGTYDISGTYEIKRLNTLLRSHFGTGFRVPSLYELYGSFLTSFGRFEIGNDRLSPERSQSFDIGFESRIGDTTGYGATFFQNEIRNEISFTGGTYKNTDGTNSRRGIEAWFERYLMDGLSFRTAYTYTEGDSLVDVPESQWDASLRYAKDRWTANIRTRWSSNHLIRVFNMDDFTVGERSEKGSFTVDSTIAYRLNKNTEVYFRAENLFSEDYNLGGYRTPGARVYGGITWQI